MSVRFLRQSAQPSVRSSLAVLILCSSLAIGSFAQNSNSSDVRGTVTDPTGAVVPGVNVAILNTETGVTTTLVTNAAGIYDAVSILPGKYQITFTGSGFQTLIRNGIDLTVGAATVDAQLTVGATQQQIEVTAEAPLLKTETAEQGTTLEAQSMQQLPNVGQDWSNFTKVLPGATGSGTGVSVNGNMPYYSNFLADGASTTLPHSANVDVSVFESVSEVQIQTSTFSAQYGIGGAVFNQISKSGTNEFHGSAYEYLQNDFFNARDFFSPSVPIERYHNFGGSIAGPIRKNKMFFYYNLDKIINNTVSYPFYTYPTAAMRAGDFSDPAFPTIYDPSTPLHKDASGKLVHSAFPNNKIPDYRIDPTARAIEQYFPTPNLPGLANNWQGGLPSTNPFIRQFGRLDYNFSDKNRLTFSITQRDNKGLGQTPDCPIDCNNYDIASYNAQVSDVWTVNANLINEFRFGFTRQGNWFTPETLGKGYPAKIGLLYAKADVFPTVTINGPVGSTSLAPGTNAIYAENSFEPSDVVTMIRGRHILHFGGEVLMYQDNSTPWGNINSGNFTFSGVFTQPAPFNSGGGLGYADFLLGEVDNWNATNTPITGARQKSPQFFVQDDFKLRPNLTINLGLRYQIQGGWSEVANRIGAFDPTLTNPVTGTKGAMWFAGNGRSNLEANVHNIFLPRVGFSWSPTSKWAIRGGFGIYSYGWSIDTYAGGAIGFGTNSTGSLAQTNQLNPVFKLSDPNPPLNYVVASKDPGAYNGQNVNYYPYHTPVARNYQWSFSVQRQLPANMLVEGAYVGSHTSNLSFPADYNQVPRSLLGVGDPQSNRPFPQFLTINGNTYNALSNYDSAQFSFTKRFSRGVSFDVNYTFSKFLDDQDSGGWGGSAGSQPYQDAHNPRLNYGFSNLDRTHMFKGDVVYQLPVGKGKALLNRGGLLDTLIGGWQVSSIFVLESGAPFTTTVSGSNNSGAITGSWYPDLVGSTSIAHRSIAEWFNTAAFAVPAPFTFGNAGRNILRGPGLADVDLSMGKNFRFPLPRETGNLQLRFDATNAFNHANFNNPDSGLGDSNFGVISSTTTGKGRILQLGARLSF